MWFFRKLDPLLEPFFSSKIKTEKLAINEFDRLWTNILCKEVEKLLTYHMPNSSEQEEREDIINETGQKLYEALRKHREAQLNEKKDNTDKTDLQDVKAYARAIARNLYVDYM